MFFPKQSDKKVVMAFLMTNFLFKTQRAFQIFFIFILFMHKLNIFETFNLRRKFFGSTRPAEEEYRTKKI